MSDDVLPKLRHALGPAGLDRDPAGHPRIAPESTEAVAQALELAATEGWRVRIEGRGSWSPADAPADLVLSTAGLNRVLRVAAPDLVATAEAGASLAALNLELADAQMWLPWDPPGHPERTLGSIVATATSGPLRHGLGPVRDYLLGCTVVTGDGRVLKPGGAVVKNVAGYDLTRLQAGGFGAFGIVTELNLRLHALPEADLTLIAPGPRDGLTAAARDLMEAGVEAAALELLSPPLAAHAEWVLAARLLGPAAGVRAEADRIRGLASQGWAELPPDQASAFWHGAARGAASGPVTLRLGVVVSGLEDVLDLLASHLDLDLVAAGAGSGSIRWTGQGEPGRLGTLRRMAAAREIPMTVERAPWPLRREVGHFGAYREGVGPLVAKLRRVFDPAQVLAVTAEGEGDG